MLPSKQVPVGSLSIQSFHDDSPPFTGAGDNAPYPPPFDLASSSTPAQYSVGPSTPSTPSLQGAGPSPLGAFHSLQQARLGGATAGGTGGPATSAGSAGTRPGLSRHSTNGTINAATAGISALGIRSAPVPSQAPSDDQRPESRASSSSAASSDLQQQPATPSSALASSQTLGSRPNGSPPPANRRANSATSDGPTLHDVKDGEADKEASLSETPNVDSGKFLAGQEEYAFPRHRLRDVWEDESKIPLVIVACGSFSPPTYLHLRMFEMAKDQIIEDGRYEILGGYYSPVSDHYKKAGLAPATDRVKMCELGVETTSMWLMVDPWEAGQDSYQRTAVVLQHFEQEINGGEEGGIRSRSGKRSPVKIMLLAGGDLIESFGHPGVWAEDDLHIILGHFGCLIIERTGSDVWAFLLSHDILHYYRKNIIVVKQLIYNDISSTKVRLFVRRGMSIKYLLPNSVISYILERGLYRSITAPYAVPLELTPSTTPAPPSGPPSTDDSAEEEDQTLVVKPAGDAQGSIPSDAGLST